jgi:hypothetical protein
VGKRKLINGTQLSYIISLPCVNKESEYVFPLQTKFVLFFVKIWYWMRYWLWMQIRYWQPYRIKRIISKKETVDNLPF